ncbi:MAG: methyltransferase domain-containing protein [Bacteroidota bacterium]|nr:methyltransferase domain-containing protein [Bacteroidota bacterium]
MKTISEKHTWTDKDVEKHWDSVANIYVEENNKVKNAHDQRFRESINNLNMKPAMKILNITSRDAEADDYIHKAEPTSEVINAEISAGLMKEAEKLRPHINQVKIDSYSDLPFQTNTFDRVLSLETLEHVSDPVQFLKEMHRVSKLKTYMVLSCPPHTSEIPYRFFTAVFGGHGEGPHRFPKSKEVKKMMKQTGWKLIHHKGTVLIPVGPKWLQDFGEKIIEKFQNTFISELGIRQFYVCEKY